MSSQLRAYGMGATNVVIGLSAVVKITPPQKAVDFTIHRVTGGGSLFIQNADTEDVASGVDVSTLGSLDSYNVGGPASFYLSAAGATMTVSLIYKFSAGASIG